VIRWPSLRGRDSGVFKVLSFGLCNAPSQFARTMELVLAGLTYDICLIYLDDILIFSRTFEEYCQRLSQVFDRLERQTLRLKASKCHLFQGKVTFLGHVVSERGIECDPLKTDVVANWPRPSNVADVRAFCGLASYYRNFVEGFAKIAHPLHDLTKKNAAFIWTEACEEAFVELKRQLTSAPVLAAPTDHGQYILDTDASDFALGAVLQQKQDDGLVHVIAYGSRSLSGPERRYCITRKEMLAVVSKSTDSTCLGETLLYALTMRRSLTSIVRRNRSASRVVGWTFSPRCPVTSTVRARRG